MIRFSTFSREEGVNQLHHRFTAEQIKVLLQGYCQGNIARTEIQELLGIGKTRFFALVKEYRHDPDTFSIAYQRETSWAHIQALSPQAKGK